MKPRRLLAPLIALLLLIPTATAYGSDQSVEVTILPAGLLTVEASIYGFGVMIPGQSQDAAGQIDITNTTSPATGWVLTVDAGDFESGNWDNCDEFGCTWVPDGVAAIAIANLSVTGGDLVWFDGPGDAIVPGSGTFGAGPITIDTATALAWGQFGMDQPPSIWTLLVPDPQATGRYRTVLTYTITAAP